MPAGFLALHCISHLAYDIPKASLHDLLQTSLRRDPSLPYTSEDCRQAERSLRGPFPSLHDDCKAVFTAKYQLLQYAILCRAEHLHRSLPDEVVITKMGRRKVVSALETSDMTYASRHGDPRCRVDNGRHSDAKIVAFQAKCKPSLSPIPSRIGRASLLGWKPDSR